MPSAISIGRPAANLEPLFSVEEPFPGTSAVNARMPPSPWLSARSTNATYLTDTTSRSDQMMSDRTPRTLSCVGCTECDPKKHSRMAYNTLVPMSPYTTPSAVNVRGNRRLRWGSVTLLFDFLIAGHDAHGIETASQP